MEVIVIEGDGEERRKKKRRTKSEKLKAAAAIAAAGAPEEGSNSKKPRVLEEVESLSSNLFVMDSTPSAVPAELSYVMAALESPTKASTRTEEATVIKALPKAKVVVAAKETVKETEIIVVEDDEDEAMRIFASEVAMDSDEDDDLDDDDSSDGDDIIFDDPKTLQQAIMGKITDDSAAKVTGRYYKEVDLTRSCSLCGGKLGCEGQPTLPNRS